MKRVAVAITHGHTSKWLQTIIYSLKTVPTDTQFDIYVACSWPNHPSIKAVKDVPFLNDGVTFIDCKRRLHSHATGLEEILEYVWDKGYTEFFTCETDCKATRAYWLDWYLSFMRDSTVGMAGFFWHEGTNHYNINPSATLYNMNMLKQYHTEARNNNEDIFWHPRGNKMGTDGGMDPTIKDLVGAFAETRGIKDPSPSQLEYILGGIPFAAWWEPGSWLFVRSIGEWENVRVPCDHIYIQTPGQPSVYTPEGTYYGSKADPYFIHYWGGTRTYDFLKHPVTDGFVKGGTPWWIKREDAIWRETVPGEYRAIVHQLNIEANVEQKMNENMGFFVPEVM